jgi:hypothetical protein
MHILNKMNKIQKRIFKLGMNRGEGVAGKIK